MTRRGFAWVALAIITAFVLGAIAYRSAPVLSRWFPAQEAPFRWPEGFVVVDIASSIDRTTQKAIFRRARDGPKRPLVVSLHAWSGDYRSGDGLAPLVDKEDWNYIHPDFRGATRGTDNCLSDKVVGDVDDAIDYAVRAGNVDPARIVIVGFSGGAYATLGMYARTRHAVRAFLAWASIADLAAWHDESTARGDLEIARQIRQCIGSPAQLNDEAARLRSPLYWPLPAAPRATIEIFAGINDGYTGPVPISHSIRFFNRLAGTYGAKTQLVSTEEIMALLSRGLPLRPAAVQTAGRTILFQRDAPFGSLTVFQGGHEIPPAFCFARLQILMQPDGAPRSR